MIDSPLPLDIILDANQDKMHFEKPTVEQVAWVFKNIMENAGKGTFRYLIYDKMGFNEEDYSQLYLAGGMAINNAMDIVYHEEEEE